MSKSSRGTRVWRVKESNTKFTAILKREEDSIRTKKKEVGIVLNSKGEVVLKKSGTKKSIAFYDNELKLMKDNVFTHNHPSAVGRTGIRAIGNAFSMEDMMTAVITDMKEMRAVTATYTFSMKRPKKGWRATPNQVHSAYRKANENAKRKFDEYIKNYKGDKRKATERANVLYWNIINKEVANKFGWKYSHSKT